MVYEGTISHQRETNTFQLNTSGDINLIRHDAS